MFVTEIFHNGKTEFDVPLSHILGCIWMGVGPISTGNLFPDIWPTIACVFHYKFDWINCLDDVISGKEILKSNPKSIIISDDLNVIINGITYLKSEIQEDDCLITSPVPTISTYFVLSDYKHSSFLAFRIDLNSSNFMFNKNEYDEIFNKLKINLEFDVHQEFDGSQLNLDFAVYYQPNGIIFELGDSAYIIRSKKYSKLQDIINYMDFDDPNNEYVELHFDKYRRVKTRLKELTFKHCLSQ